jgi:plastocyanin domain-containing protein
MSVTDWLVIVAGLAAVVWVNWYFFFAERSAATAEVDGAGRQEVTVIVRGGYDPATIRVKAGRAVRLSFDRRETSGCSEEVVFPDFNIRTFLPANQRTVIEVTPPHAGSYEFTCGMSMLHGRLVAE